MSVKQLLLDQWSALSFKRGIPRLESVGGARSWVAPTWVGEQNERRIAAYKVLYAIFRNSGREFLNTNDEDERAAHREYGDANLLVKVVLAAVMGDDISLVVEDADSEENREAVERQEWLEEWATAERFRAKVMETERDAQKLGDGVYVLTTNRAKGRVRVRLFDPGFYFPELDPNMPEDEFPTRVHIAWEFEEDDGRVTTRKVRRMTWELEELPEGERRSYPYADELSTTACYFTDAVWLVDDLDGFDVERFPLRNATYLQTKDGEVANRLDLNQDFLPVVHLPNTVEIKEHFGEALVSSVAQILDDLARADTDASKAAQLAGTPMLGIKGGANVGPTDIKVKAGTVVGGELFPIDLSAGLDAIMRYVEALRDRLSENSRIPAEVLGRVTASKDRSGIALALSFGPMRSLIEEMRLVRNEKYPLLLKCVQRMAIGAGFIAGPVLPATVAFGSFLPTDRAAVVDLALKLWAARVISRQDALQMLVDEGVLELEVAEALERAEADDVEMAVALRDATEGDFDAVYELLHRERPEDEEPEPVVNADVGPAIALPIRPPRGGRRPAPGQQAPLEEEE
jgi:hypothetical protein